MFRTRRFRTLLAIPLAVSLVLVAPTLVSAEDEDAPKRVRIKIVKESEEQAAHGNAPRADPMRILHDWFSAELQRHTPEGKGLEKGLAAWFAKGKDAPGAGLREAFKAKGWDAKKLGRWLSGHADTAHGMTAHGGSMHGMGMHGMGMQGMRWPGMARTFSGWRMRAPHARPPMGPGMLRRGPWQRGPWQRGQGMHGGRGIQHGHGMHGGRGRDMRHGHGMNRGARMGQGTGRGRYAPQSDCPDCGHQGARTHTGFRQGPMPRGPMHGPMHGSRGVGPFHGRGPGAGPNTGHTMGGMPHGTVQRDTGAYIMWNNGQGWQRMELAPGAHFGPRFQGPARGMAPGHGRMDGPQAKGRNFIKRRGAPPAGADTPDLDQLRALIQMLEGASKGAGKPGAAGQPGEPGRVGGLDPAKLKAALEMLRKLAPQGGGYAIQSGPSGPGAWLELFHRAPEKPAAQPKRVKIKSSKPKKVEVIEEIEIK